MPVKNRALTLAIRGLLIGVAISIAMHGLIQQPSSASINVLDGQHLHTADSEQIFQLHNLTVAGVVHRHVAESNDFYKSPKLVVTPLRKIGGGVGDFGDVAAFIEYRVQYRHYPMLSTLIQLYTQCSFDG